MYKNQSIILASVVAAVLALGVVAVAHPAFASEHHRGNVNVAVGGDGGIGGPGGAGGSGANGGTVIGGGSANGGHANGGDGGSANGGNACNTKCNSGLKF
jgi:hypothetical protein